MHRIVLGILSVLLLACSEDPGQSTAAASAPPIGKFTGTVGERSYAEPIRCSYLDQDYFMFKSVPDTASPSGRNGVIIEGMQNGEKFVLTVTDAGETYSTGRLARFEKGANGASGAGTLHLDGGRSSQEAQFSATCSE